MEASTPGDELITNNAPPHPSESKRTSSTDKSAQLGTAPIGKLYLGFALPMAIGMLIHGLNNIVDTYFVTRFLGANAIAGVSISFPIQMAIYAFAGMIGSGASTLVSQCLGAKKIAEAHKFSSNAVSLCALVALACSSIALLTLPHVLSLMNVSPNHLPYVLAYLKPFIYGSILVFLLTLTSDLLRAQGLVRPMMLMILISSLGNILLDAVFILGMQSGVEGAAYATLLSQACALTFGVLYFYFAKTNLQLKNFKLSLDRIAFRRITAVGAPLLLSYFGTALTFAFINAGIAHSQHPESEAMIATYGVLGRVYLFIVLPLLAMANATQTLVAYNHGAGLPERVKKSGLVGGVASFCYLFFSVLLLTTTAESVMRLFTSEETLIRQGAYIAQIYFIGLPLAGINLTFVSVFQGLGKPQFALMLSLLRTYCLFLPLIWIVPKVWGVENIWYAAPASEVITMTVVSILAILFFRKPRPAAA